MKDYENQATRARYLDAEALPTEWRGLLSVCILFKPFIPCRSSRVIECLVGESARHSAVSDNGNNKVVLSLNGIGAGNAEGDGKGASRMACGEDVVLALASFCKSGNAVKSTERREILSSAG